MSRARRKPRISHQDASRRSKEGWITRKQGGQTRITRGPRSYTWHRPSGEKVKLTGFKPAQVRVVEPALIATDRRLQEHIKVGATIKVKHPSKYRNRAGGETKTRLLRKNTIRVSPNALQKRSTWDATGLVAHELGHSIQSKNTGYKELKNYQRDFQWKTPKRQTRQGPLKRKRTRQSENMYEDFAETYRAHTGLPITRKNKRYWRTYQNPKRDAYMYRHYLN